MPYAAESELISTKEIETCAHQTEALHPKCRAMMNAFKERFGSAFCAKVRKENSNPVEASPARRRGRGRDFGKNYGIAYTYYAKYVSCIIL